MTVANRNYLDSAHIFVRDSLCCMHFIDVAMTTTTTCFFIHPSSSYQTPIIGCSAALVLLASDGHVPKSPAHTRLKLKMHRKWGERPGEGERENRKKTTFNRLLR